MTDNEELTTRVVEAAEDIDGRQTLACAKAFELARDAGVPPAEVGRICNEHHIKIRNCQLGCF